MCTVSVAIGVIFLSATKVCSTGDEEYNRDHCNCPHPQSHISEHLYETDDAVRDLILQMNIEYWQKFLKEDPDAIYRIPGKYFCFIKRGIINKERKVFSCYESFSRLVPRKEGVPDINTENGYNTLKELCPGKSRSELSEITASCLQLGDDGKVNCDSCPTGDHIFYLI